MYTSSKSIKYFHFHLFYKPFGDVCKITIFLFWHLLHALPLLAAFNSLYFLHYLHLSFPFFHTYNTSSCMTGLLTFHYFISIKQKKKNAERVCVPLNVSAGSVCLWRHYEANYFPFNSEYWPVPCWWEAKQVPPHTRLPAFTRCTFLWLFLFCFAFIQPVSCSLLHLHKISRFP